MMSNEQESVDEIIRNIKIPPYDEGKRSNAITVALWEFDQFQKEKKENFQGTPERKRPNNSLEPDNHKQKRKTVMSEENLQLANLKNIAQNVLPDLANALGTSDPNRTAAGIFDRNRPRQAIPEELGDTPTVGTCVPYSLLTLLHAFQKGDEASLMVIHDESMGTSVYQNHIVLNYNGKPVDVTPHLMMEQQKGNPVTAMEDLPRIDPDAERAELEEIMANQNSKMLSGQNFQTGRKAECSAKHFPLMTHGKP